MKPTTEELMEYAWLELGEAEEIDLSKHPFRTARKSDIENPHEHIIRLMMRPDYFPFTCKHVFNIEILPIQHVVLKELWTRAFPMLIANRGFGKSFVEALYCLMRALFTQGSKVVVVGSAFRQSKVVFEYCENIWANAPILRDLVGGGKGRGDRNNGPRRDIDRCDFIVGDSVITALPLGDGKKIRGQRATHIIGEEFACLGAGTLVETNRGMMRIEESFEEKEDFLLINNDGSEKPERFIKTPPTQAYRVTTKGGYSFVCSSIHKVQTTKGWKLGKDLSPDDFLVMPNKYVFPTEYVQQDDLVVDEKLGWLLGLLVSEGSVNGRHQISVQMNDRDCVERARKALMSLRPGRKVALFTSPAYTDSRGWNCQESFTTHCCNLKLRDALKRLGLDRALARDKKTPWSILRSPKKVVVAYLAGLFEGDGSAFLWTDRGVDNHLGVAFYSGSEQLCQETQILLHKLGFFSYRQQRTNHLTDNPQWMLRLNGRDAHEFATLLNIAKWSGVLSRAIPPKGPEYPGVVWDKSRNKWKVAVRKEDRQRYIGRFESYEKAVEIWKGSQPTPHLQVRDVELLPGEQVLYDYYIPESHAFVGNGFEQHNSIPIPIFENVVAGFGAVSASPVENVKEAARVRYLKKKKMWSESDEKARQENIRSNQLLISGTAFYEFNHFATYWKQYKNIIETRGDRKKLAALLGDQDPEGINYRDFSVIRIPMEILPERYMDEKSVARTRATISKNIYMMEYGAIFCNDSDGFFRASLINSCVVGRPDNPISLPESGEVYFSAQLKGQAGVEHYFGVDPASESDNFSIVIVAVHPDHRRVVYCWTTTRSAYKRRLKAKLTDEHDFYAYTAKKIRELMRAFPCTRILMDKQGGGVSVLEALQDPDKIPQGEMPIWEVVDPDPSKQKDTDHKAGWHVLELVQFAKADWVSEANHGLKKDLEDKVLLFPAVDPIAIGESIEQDKEAGRVIIKDGKEIALYDTLEDAVMEIEELKEELATIEHTQTGTAGRDHWDTPSTKSSTGKTGRLRKDRYSGLLMANMGARQAARAVPLPAYEPQGGWASERAGSKNPGAMYVGPEWFTQGYHGAMSGNAGAVVRRGS